MIVLYSGIVTTCDYDPALGVSSALYDNITGVLTVTTADTSWVQGR